MTKQEKQAIAKIALKNRNDELAKIVIGSTPEQEKLLKQYKKVSDTIRQVQSELEKAGKMSKGVVTSDKAKEYNDTYNQFMHVLNQLNTLIYNLKKMAG